MNLNIIGHDIKNIAHDDDCIVCYVLYIIFSIADSTASLTQYSHFTPKLHHEQLSTACVSPSPSPYSALYWLHTFLPFAGEDRDGSGLVQAVVDQDLAAGAVQPGHLDGVAARVGPVHVAGHPVHGQPVGGLQALADHRLHARAVQVGASAGTKRKCIFVRPRLYGSHSFFFALTLTLTQTANI